MKTADYLHGYALAKAEELDTLLEDGIPTGGEYVARRLASEILRSLAEADERGQRQIEDHDRRMDLLSHTIETVGPQLSDWLRLVLKTETAGRSESRTH